MTLERTLIRPPGSGTFSRREKDKSSHPGKGSPKAA